MNFKAFILLFTLINIPALKAMEAPFFTQKEASLPQLSVKKAKSAQPTQGVRCPVCVRPFKNYGGLNLHLKTHDMKRPYKCAICRLGFISEETYSAHKGTAAHKQQEKTNKSMISQSAVVQALIELSENQEGAV